MHLKHIISSVNTWADFKEVLNSKTKLEKGNAFEELTKHYLYYNPIYKSKLKTVWLQKEVPASILKKLNLPFNDQGIDLIAETNEGEFWAIQCKYLQDEDQRLSHRKISTFISLSKGVAENITYCLVCTTVDEYAELYKGKKNIGFCNSEEWNKLDKTFFDWLRNKLKGKDKLIAPYSPKPHQKKALAAAKKYFVEAKNNKGKLVFPCGAGKSLTGYWITKELNPKSIIVAVPSLSLVKQTLEVYLRETVANKESVEWLCVCSDEGIGKNDDIAIHTQDIGIPCVTDKEVIVDWLKKNKNKKTIIFTTYQSGKTIAEASQTANFKFDLGILDEAHKTVGAKDKLFSYLLFDKNIPIAKRIFMTATERRYAGSSDTILSMDDVEMYGETFATMSFKEAIETGILSDYKIITLFISDEEVKQVIQKNAFVKPIGKEWDRETEARTLASLIALRKAMDEYPIHHAVTFHSSIAKSKSFEESQAVFSKAYSSFSKVDSFHVSGAMPTAIRSKIVSEFSNSHKAIITNAKCLTEGVDVPNIDCVLFADPRKSTIDIVQAVGRALRKTKDKVYGYVILPVFTKSKTTEAIIESEEFNEVLSVLRALASNDERIIEYFRDISKGKKVNKKDFPIQFEIDERLASLIDEKELINAIQLTTWNKLAKLSWMPFEEAREFVRGLNLKSGEEWKEFCKTKNRPLDIPASPQKTYKHSGWKGMGDWLGTGTVASFLREYRPFIQAREYVHQLNFKNNNEWRQFLKSKKKPEDIPSSPEKIYKNSGWKGYGDWFGTGTISNSYREYRPFIQAKEFVHSLNLRNRDQWYQFCNSGKQPTDIPAAPENAYKNKGWKGFGDWLGTGNIANQYKEYRPFDQARKYIHSLNLKSNVEWRQFLKLKKKPDDIPSKPEIIYKNSGWKGYGDWLGNAIIATRDRKYKTFIEAKRYVHSLNLKSWSEWTKFCNSGKKPEDIPNSPNHVYREVGWKGMGDFLGTGSIASYYKVYRSFEDARTFVRKLKLKSMAEWNVYCKSGKKPDDIPVGIYETYKNEFKGMGNFLGTGNIANYNKVYRSFEDARTFVRKLKLKSMVEWNVYCKSGKKPDDIPVGIYKTYKGEFKGTGDFLGTGNIAPSKKVFLSFNDARIFVRNLKIKSQTEWRIYCKSGKNPNDIPAGPNNTYKSEWKSWGDFLGTGNIANQDKVYRSFEDARSFVRKLKLKSNEEWRNYCKSGNNKPDDIPAYPNQTYKSEWKGMSHFLGRE